MSTLEFWSKSDLRLLRESIARVHKFSGTWADVKADFESRGGRHMASPDCLSRSAGRHGIRLGPKTHVGSRSKKVKVDVLSGTPQRGKALKEGERQVEVDYGFMKGAVSVRSLDVRSLDKALDIAQVDREIWEVDRHVINYWETTMGAQKSGTGEPESYTNCQVKVWLKKKIPDFQEMLAEDIVKGLHRVDPAKLRLNRVPDPEN